MSFSTDWLLLSLRLIFIVILYFFLYQIVRLTSRELAVLARASETSASSRRPTARLILVDPAETGLRPGTGFPLNPRTLVGRHPESTIVLDDTFVSATHAQVELASEGWLVHDLGSTNGTFVNNQQVIGVSSIGDGDIVQFGRVTLRLVC
jgi:hypothetical protein